MATGGGVQVQQMEETVTYESNVNLEELMLHNSCPIHMLLKCIPQFDQIVQLYFRCKVCQQAQVHAGINSFLQHVKEVHGEFFQPQYEVVADSNNVTMVVMPSTKAEVVETIVTETQDGYHDNETYTDTYETAFTDHVETHEVADSNYSNHGESETIVEQNHYQEMITEDATETHAVVRTTSALESHLTAPLGGDTDNEGVTSEIIKEEVLTGATVIEMTPAEAEQVLIETGTRVIKNEELLSAEDGGTVVIHGQATDGAEHVPIENATVEALIGNQVIGNQPIQTQIVGTQSIETEVIGNQEQLQGGQETQVIEHQLVPETGIMDGGHMVGIGNQAIQTQVIGEQAIEVQVVAPASSIADYQSHRILTSQSTPLDLVQGVENKTEVCQEEIQITDLQMLQEQAGQIEGGEDANSLKYRRCKKCLKTFVNNHSLQRHYKETHLASPNWFVCPVPGCKYMAKRRSDIVGSHLRRRHKGVDISRWKQDPSKVKKVHLPLSAETLAENQQLIEQCMIKKKKLRVPRMAPDGNIYTCKECDLYFSNMKMLKRHHQTKHADEILWMLCPVDGCNFTCKTKRHLLEIHIPRRHRDANINYYKENKEIIQKVYLPRGMKYLPEYEEQLYTDSTEYLQEAESIARKKELAHSFPLSEICDQTEEGYSCKVCAKTFKEKKRIRQHYRIYHSDPSSRRRTRRSHLPLESMAVIADTETKTSEDTASLMCKECNRSYKSKHSLRRHYVDNHMDEIVWYMCPVAKCRYASKRHADLLHSHCERIHKGVDVSEYKKKPGLLQTLSMPPGEHPVNTSEGALFKKKKTYAVGEIADVYAVGDTAIFKCKECGRDFNSRQELRQHFGDHHAELITWYKCPVVGCLDRRKRRHELIFLHFPQCHPDLDLSQWTENPKLIKFVQLPPEGASNRSDSFVSRHQQSFPIEAVADMSVSNEDAGYRCRDCHLVFTLKKQLRQHYRDTHMGTEIWFRCPVESCGFMTSRHQEMAESHLVISHQEHDLTPWINDPALLEKVQIQLESEEEEEEHQQADTPLPTKRKRGSLPLDVIAEKQSVGESPATGMYKCSVCSKHYATVISLRRHYEANHVNQITWYKCPVQGCRYATKRDLDLFASHCSRIHKNVDVSRWKNNRRLLEVILLPPGEEPVNDKAEPLSKKRESVSQEDYAYGESEAGSFKCKYCEEEFAARNSLRHHYDAKHQDEAVTWFKCPIKSCDVIRRRRAEIIGPHFTQVHGDLDVTAWKCNPELLESVKLPHGLSLLGEQRQSNPRAHTPSTIKSERVSDTEDELLTCQHCGKAFHSAAALRRHENASHSLGTAPNIRWYKCPVGECKFITNTVSGILKTHCGRAHADVDVTQWKEDPSLIDTVEMAAGIGAGIKKTPKAKPGRPPKNKRRRLATAEDTDDSSQPQQEDSDSDQSQPCHTPKTEDLDSASLRRSGRALDKTAARLQSFLKKNQKVPIDTPEPNKENSPVKRGRRGRPRKTSHVSENPGSESAGGSMKSLPFRCNECDHNYGDVRALKNHYDLVHTDRPWYKCPVPGCRVVAHAWAEIVGGHWIAEHSNRDVSKFSKNPRPLAKVPENSIVFNSQESEALFEVKSEVKIEPLEVYVVQPGDSD